MPSLLTLLGSGGASAGAAAAAPSVLWVEYQGSSASGHDVLAAAVSDIAGTTRTVFDHSAAPNAMISSPFVPGDGYAYLVGPTPASEQPHPEGTGDNRPSLWRLDLSDATGVFAWHDYLEGTGSVMTTGRVWYPVAYYDGTLAVKLGSLSSNDYRGTFAAGAYTHVGGSYFQASAFPAALSTDEGDVVTVDNFRLMARTHGGTISLRHDDGAGAGVCIDRSTGDIYARRTDTGIHRFNESQSGTVSPLATITGGALGTATTATTWKGMALTDDGAGTVKLYWFDSTGELYRSDTDGTNQESLGAFSACSDFVIVT